MSLVLPENLMYLKELMDKPFIEVIPALKNNIGKVSHVKFKVVVNWKNGVINPNIEYTTEDNFLIEDAKAHPEIILLKMYREINRKLIKKNEEQELQKIVNDELDKEFL